MMMKNQIIDSEYFFIGLNTPSSKNSKQWTGEYFINSKTVQKWLKRTRIQWWIQKDDFLAIISELPKPLYVELTFIRDSKRKFDYNNASQIIQDCMKYNGWIIDDDMTEFKPFFGDYKVDKNNAGCLIRVLKSKPIF